MTLIRPMAQSKLFNTLCQKLENVAVSMFNLFTESK
jgi:hypothetical protein